MKFILTYYSETVLCLIYSQRGFPTDVSHVEGCIY